MAATPKPLQQDHRPLLYTRAEGLRTLKLLKHVTVQVVPIFAAQSLKTRQRLALAINRLLTSPIGLSKPQIMMQDRVPYALTFRGVCK